MPKLASIDFKATRVGYRAKTDYSFVITRIFDKPSVASNRWNPIGAGFRRTLNSAEPTWRLPASRQLLEDRDRAILDREIAPRDQILHQLPDHVARRADAI